jgi:hypothetical protein
MVQQSNRRPARRANPKTRYSRWHFALPPQTLDHLVRQRQPYNPSD